uniref:Uncharacterized protein n=1 Tax=Romanomermis culicivorax TaxID=13658 RepID=A0A915JJ72_ROMCU
ATKWKGTKAKEISQVFKLFYNSEFATQSDVGIVVSKKLRDSIVEVSLVSDRLMSLKIESSAVALRVISCYASQTNCTNNEKDEFWESLNTHIRSFKPSEHLEIGEDLNGHIHSQR